MFRVSNNKRNSDSCASCKPHKTVLSATLMLIVIVAFLWNIWKFMTGRNKTLVNLTEHIMDHKSVITDTKPFFVRNCFSWVCITHLLTREKKRRKRREKNKTKTYFRHSHRLVLSLDHPSIHLSVHPLWVIAHFGQRSTISSRVKYISVVIIIICIYYNFVHNSLRLSEISLFLKPSKKPHTRTHAFFGFIRVDLFVFFLNAVIF